MLQQFYPQVFHDFRYELNKDMQIAAAHYIDRQNAGVCQRTHGHTYVINVTIAGDDLDDSGFLVNFKHVKDDIHGRYDHSLLNDHTDFSEVDEPTTEVFARVIWERIDALLATKENRPYCLQVFVRETPTSYAVYRPKRGDHR